MGHHKFKTRTERTPSSRSRNNFHVETILSKCKVDMKLSYQVLKLQLLTERGDEFGVIKNRRNVLFLRTVPIIMGILCRHFSDSVVVAFAALSYDRVVGLLIEINLQGRAVVIGSAKVANCALSVRYITYTLLETFCPLSDTTNFRNAEINFCKLQKLTLTIFSEISY